MFTKGQKVLAYPQSYPNMVYEGEVLRKTKNGYSVKYVIAGMGFKETFSEKRLKAIV